MDWLEIRMNDHEGVIKLQNQRIQDQEETIQVVSLLVQQYLIALVAKNQILSCIYKKTLCDFVMYKM